MIHHFQNKIRVFLSASTQDVDELHSLVQNVIKRAEIDILCPDPVQANNENYWKNDIKQLIEQSNCSLHILGNEYRTASEASDLSSINELQFNAVQEHTSLENQEYKIFIWQPFNHGKQIDPKQEKFINSIKNSMMHNVIISQHESPVILVEDINIVMSTKESMNVNVIETDVFYIYNELDEDFAIETIDLLKDVMKVEKFKLSQNAQQDYSQYIVEQVKLSKLVVVFFKWTCDWALPFTQQLWKLMGGASSPTSILLLGSADYPVNQGKSFDAPKVTSIIVADELIPLEIKVQYDKIVHNR